MSTKKWIKDTIGHEINDSDIKLGSEFLMVWSIFEASCNNDSFNLNLIKKAALVNDDSTKTNEIEELFLYFFERYKTPQKFRDLKGSFPHNTEIFEDILSKDISSININDKTKFLLYVVYRFRNNMFHGSKGLKDWTNMYKVQINKSINTITLLHGKINYET